jgi:hypothetical protein
MHLPLLLLLLLLLLTDGKGPTVIPLQAWPKQCGGGTTSVFEVLAVAV